MNKIKAMNCSYYSKHCKFHLTHLSIHSRNIVHSVRNITCEQYTEYHSNSTHSGINLFTEIWIRGMISCEK